MAITQIGESQTFGYTGNVQSFDVPFDGIYKLEVWGAEGGERYNTLHTASGHGGYSIGYKRLKKGQTLYIAVGGRGGGISGLSDYNKGYTVSAYVAPGGWNGGGQGRSAGMDITSVGGGGGATHIAINSNRGELKNYASYKDEILIVAGGGGGEGHYGSGGSNGGSGGGLSGNGIGGSQTSAGARGGFGYGGDFGSAAHGYGGGGGGWYGGGCPTTGTGGGGGGSGYIGGVPNFSSGGVAYNSSTTNGGGSGHGSAKITYMAKGVLFNFDDGYQTKEITGLIFDDTKYSGRRINIAGLNIDGIKYF